MVERSHDELEELLGAYSIDAVDADERAAVEQHLARCPRCRSEVTDLREVSALLVPTSEAAPEGAWDRLVASLDETPPPMRLEVVPLASRRSRWRRVAIAAGSVAAAVIAVFALQARDTGGGVDHLRAAAQAALSDPASRIAQLRNDDGQKIATAVVTSDGQGYLLGEGMAPLNDQIYELWGATSDGRVVALGVMEQPGVRAFAADQSVTTILLTEEDHPVDRTTNHPVVSGHLA